MEALKTTWPILGGLIALGALIVALWDNTNSRIESNTNLLSARIETNTNLIRDLTVEVRANREESTDQILDLSKNISIIEWFSGNPDGVKVEGWQLEQIIDPPKDR